MKRGMVTTVAVPETDIHRRKVSKRPIYPNEIKDAWPSAQIWRPPMGAEHGLDVGLAEVGWTVAFLGIDGDLVHQLTRYLDYGAVGSCIGTLGSEVVSL